MSDPRLLVTDIETAPGQRYFWRLFDENGSIDQIIKPTRILCFSAKFVGEKPLYFQAEWSKGGTRAMLKALAGLIAASDAVVTQNGERFDLPRINGAFLLAGLPPITPVASIDIYKTIKQLGFDSGKLGYVGPLLGCGAKVKHEGFDMWKDIEAGKPEARRVMQVYNGQDVRMTEKVYLKIRPFIKNHPWLGTIGKTSCPSCGSKDVQRRGERRTKSFFIERLHCQSCGAWADGARRKAK